MLYHTQPRCRVVVCPSRRLRAIRHLASFLDVDAVLSPQRASHKEVDIRAIVTWGRRGDVQCLERLKASLRVPIWYLEDGWIRTSAANAHARMLYSLLVDTRGVYYDSEHESDIVAWLNLSDRQFQENCGSEEIAYAQCCRHELVDNGITKYNFCRKSTVELPSPLVLVVDQTCDDASVRLGGMNARRFDDMLDAACDEHGVQHVVVRTHPDVVQGRRAGYLVDTAKRYGVKCLAESSNPIIQARAADKVYTGTSQLGYEALLCGRPVSVFGRPFYAGWGLTEDHQPIQTRIRKRSIDQLFHVSHVRLARYRNPVDGSHWRLHDCLSHVRLQKACFARNANRYQACGIALWKRGYVAQYLRSPDGSIVHTSRKAPLERGATRLTWGFRRFTAHNGGERIARIEDGFLRSTGLGSDLCPPGSLVIDHRGLYFDCTSPSDLEELLNGYTCTDSELQRAAKLRERIVRLHLSKYNLGRQKCTDLADIQGEYELVVGQVEDDESIRRGCRDIACNSALLAAVRQSRPHSYLVYKPHPDVLSGNRKGMVDAKIQAACADRVVHMADITSCIEHCVAVHTMTSLAGFEALLRNKPVYTYGLPFYAGWGLTEDRHRLRRRTRARSLDDLVYIVLIRYPCYIDIASGEFIEPEALIEQIASPGSASALSISWSSRQWRKVMNLVRGLAYAP